MPNNIAAKNRTKPSIIPTTAGVELSLFFLYGSEPHNSIFVSPLGASKLIRRLWYSIVDAFPECAFIVSCHLYLEANKICDKSFEFSRLHNKESLNLSSGLQFQDDQASSFCFREDRVFKLLVKRYDLLPGVDWG
ncbi:hypothetical protein ACET3Z_031163 [Daucus carota]